MKTTNVAGFLPRFLLGACLAASVAAAPAQDSSANLAGQIDELLTRTFPSDAPGAAVLVVSRGEMLEDSEIFAVRYHRVVKAAFGL